ncbi:carbonic anhydrase [Streptomyces sp. DT224]|uniref:carbonic anhydrase n=1 Tax=unclassified Streptomyces TaxID=2593676 RepID=UPI0011CE0807|nr:MULTISPECIES: carbonic anhydrase [unclassified Streptomyces]WRZ03572.1 carbonic anhydrase [Streptomyces sp. NBC_00385]
MMAYFVEQTRSYAARAAAHGVDLDQFAGGQAPQVLFISCSDARLAPAWLTGSRPGELLELRTHGGTVSRYQPENPLPDAVTIEFAVERLNVADIIVCGHSQCEVVRADVFPGTNSHPGSEDPSAGAVTTDVQVPQDITTGDVTAAGHLHVIRQLDVLSDYPCIALRMADNSLRLHAWFHEVETGATLQHRPTANAFLPL